MLEMFLVTLAVMLFVISGMAVGAMAGRKPLTGSCGGVGKLMGEDCEFCEKADQCTEVEKSHCDGSGKIVLSVQAGCPVELKVD